ncbi:MAG: dihydroneopterin aldolase [Cyanobium sp. MAG06]|nr:dihydroneopterin aldolase [Cyanobium sp. MAG06]
MKIYIKDLIIQAKHGYYKKEQENPQRFIVNLVIDLYESVSCETDDLNDTINYEILRDVIIAELNGDSKILLEHLSNNIAKKLLTYKIIKNVEINICKPDIFPDCNVGVILSKSK